MTLAQKFNRCDQYCLFFQIPNDADGSALFSTKTQKEEYKQRYVQAFTDGLFKPFDKDNGGVLEHAALTVKYPVLHLLKVVTDLLSGNIPGAIVHAVAIPFSLAYFLVGLISRTIASLANICCDSTPEDDSSTAQIV